MLNSVCHDGETPSSDDQTVTKNILLSSLILVYDSLYLEHPKFVPKAQKKQPHLVVEVPQETLIRRQVHDVKVGTFTMALSGSTEGWARDDEGSKKCSK